MAKTQEEIKKEMIKDIERVKAYHQEKVNECNIQIEIINSAN
jgi:hypothetical protein